jgi:hypothetical protein
MFASEIDLTTRNVLVQQRPTACASCYIHKSGQVSSVVDSHRNARSLLSARQMRDRLVRVQGQFHLYFVCKQRANIYRNKVSPRFHAGRSVVQSFWTTTSAAQYLRSNSQKCVQQWT